MPHDSTRLIADVLQSLKRAGLGRDDRVIVGLSGGVDSLTLTHILAALRDAGQGPSLHAVHVDHGLRATSAQDAQAVRRLAQAIGAPLDVVRVDVASWETGRGVEAAARDARYAALAGEAARHEAGWILLGHTLDDQVETVLLRLLRGSGLDGLTGMGEISARAIPLSPFRESSAGVQILRPMIHSRRAQIDAYASCFGLHPVEDESNSDHRFRRNAIRHQLLPLIEQIVPGAVGSIARTAGLLQADAEFISAAASEVRPEVLETVEDCPALKRELFSMLPASLQRRLVATTVQSLTGEVDLTSERIEAVRAAALSGSVSSFIQIAVDIVAYVDYDRIVFGKSDEIVPSLRRAAGRPVMAPASAVELNHDTTITLGDRWELDVRAEHPAGWVLRTRQPGDRVRLGSGRSQRIQDWFVNQRVPRYLRDHVPLFVQAGTIRWVIGFSSPDFEDVDSGIAARLRERPVEDRTHVQCHSKHPAS